ncbi:DUF1585 domain-containing protein [Opitutia bacterium ISCC 51]|nr:DUF1585 domain-containing protein [Opitutae bacterium ISCC 51]QXD27254.1 DUF1585 domain-containing protein [Opitutae bacterium ISCC 52]
MPQFNKKENDWFLEELYPHEAILRAWLASRFSTIPDFEDIIQEAYIRTVKRWRTQDFFGEGKRKKVWDIDVSGAFHKGPAFGDYHELRDLVAQREDDFARGFVEHLIGYALGRPFGFTDEDLAIEIVSSAKKDDYAVSAFIHALVRSEAFQKK